MENRDKISIITVSYNNATGLLRTIESVKKQDYARKEFIVVDGGSTDNTRDIISEYSSIINICISEKDRGIYDALNKGIKKASGKWIVCMNAGDVFYADNTLSRVFEETISECKRFIYSDAYVEQSDGKGIRIPMDRKQGDVYHQACIYEKSLHNEYGYYLVTKEYIVSDLLFFLSVPEELFYKTDTLIAKGEAGGISQQGFWTMRGAIGLKVTFKIKGLHRAYWQYIKVLIVDKLVKIKHALEKVAKRIGAIFSSTRKEN